MYSTCSCFARGGYEPTVSDTVVDLCCVRWSVFGGQSKGNQNQRYLIQLGEERKLGNRNERRREGKRWATIPPTVSDTVGFSYL